MIKFYFTTSSGSCRKAKAWLLKNNLPFEEINLKTTRLTKEELLHILSLTQNGTHEIISKGGKAYKSLSVDLEQMTLNELFDVLNQNRLLLKRPLLVDEDRLLIAYNEDDIRKFIPRHIRRIHKAQIDLQLSQEILQYN